MTSSSSSQNLEGRNYQQQQQQLQQEKQQRRIYSPYDKSLSTKSGRRSSSNNHLHGKKMNKNDQIIEKDDVFDQFGDKIEDEIDRFGNLFADSVDKFVWGDDTNEKHAGNDDDEDDGTNNNGIGDEIPSTPTRASINRNAKRRQPRRQRRHWKDRAEEKLDQVLGFNLYDTNMNNTYDRWKEKELRDTAEDEERGYDAVSFIRGRKRPRRKRNGSSSSFINNKKIPFWEEEGSVLSVLLGHNWDDSRPPQRTLRSNLEDVIDAFRSSKSITACIRQVFLLSARVVGSLCRWASVRDTIPRPFVFLSAFTAGFISRPDDRIKNMLLTFLSVRVFGEWLTDDDKSDRDNERGHDPLTR